MIPRCSRMRRFLGASLPVLMLLFVGNATSARAQWALVQLSHDTFTNNYSEHRSEVEPDVFAWGSTIVSAFQVARVFDGGGADIGFATSTNGGVTWTHGYLPGLTINYLGGSFSAASDAAVAYDAKHGVWLISTLPILNNSPEAVAVSRSSDGINWGNPILVDNSGSDDKNWIVCDNTSTSPYYGNCYSEWDEPALGDLVFMSTSHDGGLTWSAGVPTADHASGLGGQPLVQPNGTVVVPFDGFGGMEAFRSTNGGASWSTSVVISNQLFRGEDGGLRSPGLPSAAVDGAGKVYVVWPDCRFRTGCNTDDIVMSTSTDGTTWTSPVRIPIHSLTSTFDHFIPGIGIDPNTSGSTAHITMTYYYYPVASCGNACKLDVGFTSSLNGGQTWVPGKYLAGPMTVGCPPPTCNNSWLPNSQNGLMVADYLAVAFSNGNPFGVFAVAHAPSLGLLNQQMYTTKTALTASPLEPDFTGANDKPVPGVSGRYVWKYYDDDGEYPIPPEKQVAPARIPPQK